MSNIQGGVRGLLLRRFIHVSMIFIPIIYYFYWLPFASHLNINKHLLFIFLLLIIICAEIIRLVTKKVFFGQRSFEAKQISSFTSGAVGIILVLWLAPANVFGFCIIWSWALADPFLAVLREQKWHKLMVFIAGTVLVILIWIFFLNYFNQSWYWIFLAPIIIAVEFPQLKWVDDNLLMQLIPLMIVLIKF